MRNESDTIAKMLHTSSQGRFGLNLALSLICNVIVHCVPGTLTLGVERSGRGADH